jgi:hypothetical protein
MADIELSVCTIPYRKGKWLCTTEGSVFRPLAKFRDEDAVTEFFRWVDGADGCVLRRGVNE